MIVDVFKVKPKKQEHLNYDEGCTCAASGHPPCSWCENLTEEECDILDSDGYQAVLLHRGARDDN